MKSLIVANWKLNPVSQKEAKQLFDAVKKGVAKAKNADVVICPPFIYLSQCKGLSLGAQNVFYKEKGAFTGEISPQQLHDLKVEHVIIGHSERRKYFQETNEAINKKIKAALEAKLTPILCIGETEEEKNHKAEVLTQQMVEGLQGISSHDAKNIVIAYEPVWAIGTGNNCSVDETMGSIMLIRKIISNIYNRELADHVKILYGGSVKPENAASYIKDGGANGLLVGGASLIAEDFIKIAGSV